MPLHDVGKAGISESILTKPGPLSPEEWEEIKRHPREGNRMLAQSKSKIHEIAAVIALEHHEHWDGAGYPQGLKGDAIRIEGRITAIADVLDSLLCKNCYRDAWDFEKAFNYVIERGGSQFDPALVSLLSNNKQAIQAIYRS